VRRAIQETGVDPRLLKLEVTEAVLMRDFEAAATTIEQLRALGIGTWVDNFGTGYSCFGQLHRLPVETIKISGEFVQDIGKHPGILPLIRGMVTLAHSLGLQTVAESVESEEQLTALRAAACDQAQGFLLARPRPADDLEWNAGRTCLPAGAAELSQGNALMA